MGTKKRQQFTSFFKITPYYSVSYSRPDNFSFSNRISFNVTCPACAWVNACYSKIIKKVTCSNCLVSFHNPFYSPNILKGHLSAKAQLRLKNSFNWLLLISPLKTIYSKKENIYCKFKLNFITLTLSDTQMHSDYYIKKHLLDPFLRWLHRSHSVNSFIWKAESQNNGNIHFHITTNKFIHWKSVRAKWNRLLAAHGYCKVFQDGTNDRGNAATQIKAVRNVKEITSYMLGYINKKDLFKSDYNNVTKKKKYIMSDHCPVNNHYYHRTNYRQCICENGQMREYKRLIEGKIWATSSNLNESAYVISSNQPGFELVNKSMNDPFITNVFSNDYWKLYTYKKKIMKWLPVSVNNEIKDKINALKNADGFQKLLVIDSFN